MLQKAFLYLLIICAAHGELFAESSTSDQSATKNKFDLEVSNFSDFFGGRTDSAFKGVLLGNIIYLDPEGRFIFFKPKEDELPRVHVYLDDKTLFSVTKLGSRAPLPREQLLEGQRVAARVVIKHGVVLADEVFLVNGEFEPRSRYKKQRYSKRSRKK